MLSGHSMNPVLRTPPRSDPSRLLHYRDRQYAAELLAAAILHFDLFTWLDRHPGADTAALCSALGFASRPADVLLTLCRANGLLATDAAGGHRLTPVAGEYLVTDSPWFLGPYYQPIRDTPIVKGFLEVLRSGKPANWQAKADGKDWHASMQSEDFARSFTDLMNCRGLVLGQALAAALAPSLPSRAHLLDVAGGSGIYSAALVAVHPDLRATVLEQSPVDAIARREIARHGLSERIDVATGDMFRDPWPAADAVLLSNVLHDWDLPEVRRILVRAAESLSPGGLVIIHDAFLDDAKDGPIAVAEYSALLANITQGRCYSAAEYGAVLAEVGFEPGPFRSTVADRGFMTARKRSA
jgi:predicted O-methyltransferase YrrM